MKRLTLILAILIAATTSSWAYAAGNDTSLAVSSMITDPKVLFGLISFGLLLCCSQRPRHKQTLPSSKKELLPILLFVGCVIALSYSASAHDQSQITIDFVQVTMPESLFFMSAEQVSKCAQGVMELRV